MPINVYIYFNVKNWQSAKCLQTTLTLIISIKEIGKYHLFIKCKDDSMMFMFLFDMVVCQSCDLNLDIVT